MDDLGEMETKKYQKIMSDAFNQETDTIKYLGNKIYVSYLRAATGCADYYGDISFKDDTINLLFKNKGDIVCTEQDVYRVNYEIANNDRKKFIFKKY